MFNDRRVRPARSTGTILVVDDLASNITLLEEILQAQGFHVLSATNGEEGVEVAARELPDLVLSDVRMPLCDGFDLCRALKAAVTTRLIPVVLMTGAAESDDRIRAIEAGANDIVNKPIDQPELKARVRSLLELKRYTDELDSAEAVLRSLALMIEARDVYTEGHCERLSRYAVQLGLHLGLPEEDLQALNRGGYFHDIGKIALPDAILLKPGELTPVEADRMRQHTVVGDQLCGDLRVLHQVRPIVRHHHERLDGSGYPDGLSGEAVPLLAQLIGIVDVYDALTTARAYRGAMAPEAALGELEREAARGWRRRDLIEAFAESLRTHQLEGGR